MTEKITSPVQEEIIETIDDKGEEIPKKQTLKMKKMNTENVSDEKVFEESLEETNKFPEISKPEDNNLKKKPEQIEEINKIETVADVTKKPKPKLKPMKIETKVMQINEAQYAENIEGPQFAKLKLKKPIVKPKQETTTVTLPKFQLKSRIKHITDWPPEEIKSLVTFLGSIRQNGILSRNIKEAAKIKKKVPKVPLLSDLERPNLEQPEQFEFSKEIPEKSEPISLKMQQENEDTHVIVKKLKEKPLDEITEQLQIKIKKSPISEQTNLEEDMLILKKDEVITEEPADQIILEIQQPSKTIIEETASEESIPKIPEVDIVKEKKIKKRKEKPIQPDTDNVSKVSEDIPEEILDQRPKIFTDEIIEKVDEELTDQLTAHEFSPELQVDAPTEKILKKPKKPKKGLEKLKPTSPEKDFGEETQSKEMLSVEEDLSKDVLLDSETPKSEKLKQTKVKKVLPLLQDTPIEKVSSVEETKKLDVVEIPPDKKKKLKLEPIKIERKTLQISKAQHAENIEGPQFVQIKLKKSTPKPKQDVKAVTIPKFQLKSRIKYVNDWPPEEIKPVINYLGSIRDNGILSRNVKEASKIKKKVYKPKEIPDLEKTQLEKPMFGHEDIIETTKQDISTIEEDQQVEEDAPEEFTIKPRRPSVKKTEEITDEVTIKKKLKPLPKSSVTLPEITEPESVTFRPKSTKTKEDVEQEFNIQLDSYAEEEISMSSKVKLKPQRQPTFAEDANETSIQFYEEEEGPDIVEIIESDIAKSDETAEIMMPLKRKAKKPKTEKIEDITSNITMYKPRKKEEPSEITEEVSFKLEKKPKYIIDDQEEVYFDIKPQTEQFTNEELSLSSKIKLKSKRKPIVSEAADETSIQLTQEIEDDSQAEEIILSEGESDENIEMVIRRKPKKPTYEISEVEELSVELKPKKINEDYEEEKLTISTKRKPKKPTYSQGI